MKQLMVWCGLVGWLLAQGVGCSRSAPEVDFPPRLPEPVQVSQLWEQEKDEVAGYTPAGTAKAVLEAVLAFNQLLTSDRPSTPVLEQASLAIKLGAKRLLEDEGTAAVRKVCLVLLVRFDAALLELVKLSATVPDSTQALLSGAPPPPALQQAFARFCEVGGDFLLNAGSARLIRPAAKEGVELAEGAPFFARLAFKVRFASMLPDATEPMTWLLSDFERQWYDLWVVERSASASLERKFESIARLKRNDPSYRDLEAVGIVTFRAGAFPRAARAFADHLKAHPDDARVKGFLEAAQRKLR